MRNIERQNKDNRTGYIAQNNIYILVERLYLGKSEFMKIRKLLCLVFVLLSVCSNLIYMNVFAKEEKTVEERFDYRELEKAQPRIVSGDEGSDRDSVITKQSMSTEASLSSSEKGWKLPKDAINYRYIFQESRQIASIEQKGVYFLNDSQLTVYSLESLQGEEVYTFPSIVKDSYTAKGKLYVLSSGESSGESLISVYNLKQKKFEDTLSLMIQGEYILVEKRKMYLIFICCLRRGEFYQKQKLWEKCMGLVVLIILMAIFILSSIITGITGVLNMTCMLWEPDTLAKTIY